MGRRIALLVAWLGFVVALAELAARLFLVVSLDASLLDPRTAIFGFYSYLPDVMEEEIERGDEPVDVLLLGGSVLHRRWGSVDVAIEEQIVRGTRREVRIHNLARPAHSSRDSLLKYERLGAQSFDLVVFYHGINETRANNVPPEQFDAEYDHYAWYREINMIDRDRWLGLTAMPFTVRFLSHRLALLSGRANLVPRHEPRKAWLEYGADVKTAASFEANLEAIARIAAERREPLLLLSFAFHAAPGYSKEAFRARELDYTRHRCEIENWGRPQHVIAALEAHNEAVRAVAARRPELFFVDVARLLPGGRKHFDDVCHLTTAGSSRLAELIAPAMLAAIDRDAGGKAP